MVPAAFVLLPSLPLSATGKIDRAVLAASAPDTAEASDGYVAPRTPIEAHLAAIWAEVLGAPRVGVDDDFFALGGHSLVATRVVSRVRDAFRVALPLRALFEHPDGGRSQRGGRDADSLATAARAVPRWTRPLSALSEADVAGLPEADVDTMLAAYSELNAAADPTAD